MTRPSRLRQLLSASKLLVAPGAYDSLSAKIIERTGFSAVYVTGYGASASVLGEPDVGLLTMTEMVKRAGDIAHAVSVPVIADADTGFGNPLNVRRTVREYERAGVCAVQLEDQVSPKRCGHMLGRDVIPVNKMVQKIRAAIDSRCDDDLVIIARTDARTTGGLVEAIRRGKSYEEAGADVIFVESPESEHELRTIARSFPNTPTLVNMIETGRTPLLSVAELEDLGFRVAIFPVGPLFAAARAVNDYAVALRSLGVTTGVLERLMAFESFNQLVGLPECMELVDRYGVEDGDVVGLSGDELRDCDT